MKGQAAKRATKGLVVHKRVNKLTKYEKRLRRVKQIAWQHGPLTTALLRGRVTWQLPWQVTSFRQQSEKASLRATRLEQRAGNFKLDLPMQWVP